MSPSRKQLYVTLVVASLCLVFAVMAAREGAWVGSAGFLMIVVSRALYALERSLKKEPLDLYSLEYALNITTVRTFDLDLTREDAEHEVNQYLALGDTSILKVTIVSFEEEDEEWEGFCITLAHVDTEVVSSLENRSAEIKICRGEDDANAWRAQAGPNWRIRRESFIEEGKTFFLFERLETWSERQRIASRDKSR